MAVPRKLKDDMEDDLEDFFDTDEFAETIGYGSKEIPAIIDRIGDPEISGPNASTKAEIHVKAEDVEGIEAMQEVDFDDHIWIVDKILSNDKYVVKFLARRKEGIKF